MTHYLLAGLDSEQRIAAESLRGPVCMLAGAGTGKTRAIAHRIAYGVVTGVYAPKRVMALTFTSRAAAELRGRLRDLGAGDVSARTFHSTALSQLSYFWPQVMGGSLPSILPSKSRTLAQVAESLSLNIDTATLRDVAGEIEWRKVSGVPLDVYAELALTRKLGLSVESMLAMHAAYEELKDTRRQLDFEDVLLATAGMIENETAVAMHVREQYRFFVVDEFQDVSPIQQRLLALWLGERRDVCVVGDASQTIYSFAGARAEFLLDFPRRFSDATVVRLDQSYRSTAAIIDVANRLMRDRAGAVMLRPAGEAGTVLASQPRIRSFDSDEAEAEAVAQSVSEEIAAGLKAQEIAVLYRVNVQAAALERVFADAGISYHVRGAKRFFDLPEVRQAVMALRAASVSLGGEPLFKSVSDVLCSLGWTSEPPDVRGAVRERWESLRALVSLVDGAPSGMTFRQFTDELMERQAAQHEPTMNAVAMATLHSAKGLEWKSVYVVGLSDGLVPLSYSSTPDQVDEERRLLYVGITRAQERLHLSWATAGLRGRGVGGQRREVSRFLQEIGIRTQGEGGTLRDSSPRSRG